MSNIDEQVSTIDKILSEITSIFISNDGNHSPVIFTIDDVLRERHEAAYEPKMVSIGPYHRGKNNLQTMEKLKWVYLNRFLYRRNETSADRYIRSLLQDDEKARTFYTSHVPLNPEEFAKMMLLDGCFILEFMKNYATKNDHNYDPIFKMKWVEENILRDLLLLENQIPFFILDKLFGMTKISNNPTPADQEHTSLISLALSCLNDAMNDKSPSSSVISQPENVIHLLSLMYESWCSSFTQSFTQLVQNGSTVNGNNRPPEFSCIDIIDIRRKNPEDEDEEDLEDIMFIKSVTELNHYGIKFVKSEQSTSWLDIEFENGEIKIPPLVIQSCTEDVIRNLTAYEHYKADFGYSGKFVTDYTTFMDCLINTPMDVQKLREKGIIKNWLGNDQDVTNMFNRIRNNIFRSPRNFTYRTHFKNVNKHCNERRNEWIYDLNETYFKNPWSIIALFAATFLLILTSIQTVLSFLQTF